jgi:leader peptidase (prepilin peptidase)/N-methyltransferase
MDILWLIFLFVLGACVGSFLNVVVYRMPRGESIAFPPSHCPGCGRPIKWYDNIPLVSWLLLRGRCRACEARISPRYPIIEGVTAVLVAGLYALYFLLDVRDGSGPFADAWPMYAAHAVLLCALLASSLVDAEHWIVPLEVCWFATVVGFIAAAADPHPWLPRVPDTTGAASVGAMIGLGVSLVLQHYGIIQPSFLDAEDGPVRPVQDEPAPGPNRARKPDGKQAKPEPDGPRQGRRREKATAVAITRDSGVSPRREVLREVIFLAPAVIGAFAAWALVTHIAAIGDAWGAIASRTAEAGPAPHVNALLSAVFGYLVGGLWIWGIRIVGTLGFGKEAMGLGDVHILAAVGAVTGWIVPSVAFFVAPVFGLLWAVFLWLGREQRELPYGPWLAAASFVVMLFYDAVAEFLRRYVDMVGVMTG